VQPNLSCFIVRIPHDVGNPSVSGAAGEIGALAVPERADV